ncbi:hypothetical protein EYR40_003627 [Pleurotus pulmonarius]|nr:hypothetical protein EYR36_007803 [Pleurotus pulmonarius]KAF4604845.1 hypothetical protein EYR40_003627 [Pleurotus pulmonarius]
MLNLDVQSFVFAGSTPTVVRSASPPTNVSPGLRITAKRYRHTGTQSNVPSPVESERLTLLFLHCVGAHKEQWEPTIQAIFERTSKQSPNKTRVREAWSFDWQNHGDAAVLNKSAGTVTVYDWAAAISAFVKSDHVKGHKIIPIGHSAGATTVVLTTKYLPLELKPYPALILVEPSVVTKELFEKTIDDRMEQMELVVRMTTARRDHWASKDEAFVWLSKRYPWSTWDLRIVKLLVDHGLEQNGDGARLKCDRKHEAVSYTQVEGHFEAANLLSTISKTIPVHLIWGENEDIIPEIIRDSLNNVSAGMNVASVRAVEDAGHMIVQEKPDALAKAICEVLYGCIPPCSVQTKL